MHSEVPAMWNVVADLASGNADVLGPLLQRGGSVASTAGAHISAGSRVRVLRGRQFKDFGGGDGGVVVRLEEGAGWCDVAFDGRLGEPLRVALRHLELVGGAASGASARSSSRSQSPSGMQRCGGAPSELSTELWEESAAAFDELAAKDAELLATLRRDVASVVSPTIELASSCTTTGMHLQEPNADTVRSSLQSEQDTTSSFAADLWAMCRAEAGLGPSFGQAIVDTTPSKSVNSPHTVSNARLHPTQTGGIRAASSAGSLSVGFPAQCAGRDVLAEAVDASASATASAAAANAVEVMSLRIAFGDLRNLLLQETEQRVASFHGLDDRLEALRSARNADNERLARTEQRWFSRNQGEVHVLCGSVQALKDQIEMLEMRTDKLSERCDRVDVVVRNLDEVIKTISSSFDEGFRSYDGRFKAFERSHAEAAATAEARERAFEEQFAEQASMFSERERKRDQGHAELSQKLEELANAHNDVSRSLGEQLVPRLQAKLDALCCSHDIFQTRHAEFAPRLQAQLEVLTRSHENLEMRHAELARLSIDDKRFHRLSNSHEELVAKTESLARLHSEQRELQERQRAWHEANTDKVFADLQARFEEISRRHLDFVAASAETDRVTSSRLSDLIVQLEELERAHRKLTSTVSDSASPVGAVRLADLALRLDELKAEVSTSSGKRFEALVAQLSELERSHAEILSEHARRFTALEANYGNALVSRRTEVTFDRSADRGLSLLREEMLADLNQRAAKLQDELRAELKSSFQECAVRVERQASEAVRMGSRAVEALEANGLAARETGKMLDVMRERLEDKIADGLAAEARLREESLKRVCAAQASAPAPATCVGITTSPPAPVLAGASCSGASSWQRDSSPFRKLYSPPSSARRVSSVVANKAGESATCGGAEVEVCRMMPTRTSSQPLRSSSAQQQQQQFSIGVSLAGGGAEVHQWSHPPMWGAAPHLRERRVPVGVEPIAMAGPILCVCGNAFLADVEFCRKCGARRPHFAPLALQPPTNARISCRPHIPTLVLPQWDLSGDGGCAGTARASLASPGKFVESSQLDATRKAIIARSSSIGAGIECQVVSMP